MTDAAVLSDRPHTRAYLRRMRACATSLGRDLADVSPDHLVGRLVESDAALISRGFEARLLSIEGNYLVTRDPRQGTAWLVEGDPARLCWEYVPHAAAYTELILDLGYPVGSVLFETPESEAGMSLDLAVLDTDGRACVLGEVKTEGRQIDSLVGLLPGYVTDPGHPPPVRRGGPSGSRREAWKLAHQLWLSRVPWLWLVTAGRRLAFEVDYADGLALRPRDGLPPPDRWAPPLATDWPSLHID